MMDLSLGEVETACRRAARGAGLAWGHAEEACRAARWLCERGQDGAGALAACLEGATAGGGAPRVNADGWAAAEGPLCAVQTGAALADFGATLPDRLLLRDVCMPLLLLPFIADLARGQARVMMIACDTGQAATDGDALWLSGDLRQRADVILMSGDRPRDSACTAVSRADVAPDDWQELARHAAKTYAPATEASRLSGAGAGLGDND